MKTNNNNTRGTDTVEKMPAECLRRGCTDHSRCHKDRSFYGCTNMPKDWGPIDPDSLT